MRTIVETSDIDIVNDELHKALFSVVEANFVVFAILVGSSKKEEAEDTFINRIRNFEKGTIAHLLNKLSEEGFIISKKEASFEELMK